MEEKETLKEIFTKVYLRNTWGDASTVSGEGSNLKQTMVIREKILDLLSQFKIHTILDAPCGDFFWMKEIINKISSSGVNYLGVDIVKEIIDSNSANFGNTKVSFLNLNLIDDTIPKVDMILTRDCFIHLSFSNIFKIIRNYRESNSKYLLLSTYTDPKRKNKDIDGSRVDFRALNMQKFPFLFPDPLIIINESCTEYNGDFSDKSLALWEIDQINILEISLNIYFYKILDLTTRIVRKIARILKIKN
jgi:hypothetical protein